MTTLHALAEHMLQKLWNATLSGGFGQQVDIVPFGLEIEPDPQSVWQATKHLETEGLISCVRESGEPPACLARVTNKARLQLEARPATSTSTVAHSEQRHPVRSMRDVDVGIITIKREELDEVLRAFPNQPSGEPGVYVGPKSNRHYNIRTADAGNGELYRIAIVRQTEQGNGEAHATARDILEELEPKLILVVGIAGGAPSNDFSLGDIVLSTRVNDYSVSALKNGEPEAYSMSGGPIAQQVVRGVVNLSARTADFSDWDAHLKQHPTVQIEATKLYGPQEWRERVEKSLRTRFDTNWDGPRFVSGVIASSDSLIKTPEPLISWLTNSRDVCAVEMESAGAFRALNERCPFLAIRALSDMVGFTRDEQWTLFACKAAAAFAKAYLRTAPLGHRHSVRTTTTDSSTAISSISKE